MTINQGNDTNAKLHRGCCGRQREYCHDSLYFYIHFWDSHDKLDYGERKKLSKVIDCYATLFQGPTVGQGLHLNQ